MPLLFAMFGQIEEAPDRSVKLESTGRPTLGGTQYWTDYLVCHGWRIQRNVEFGQFRLLKPTNRVAETGTYDQCRQAFVSVCRQPDFPPIPATVLVTVHGLGRTRNSMSAIGKYVSEEGEFGWINFGYASTRSTIADNAAALRHVLDELTLLKHEQDAQAESMPDERDGIHFHFIGHSLGNIVIRQMLSDFQHHDVGRTAPKWHAARIVMLGPPNQGSAMASLLRYSIAFRLIAGPSGKAVGAEWDELQERLITPTCEFAIIAGGKSDEQGYNPLLSGDDDLIVGVEETKLSGAADFTVIPSLHTVLPSSDESKEMALRFLQSGHLKSVEEQRPIP
jgi:hypothetical protein